MAFKRSSVRSRLSPPENANGFAVRVFRWIDTKAISDPKRSHPVYLRQQILARKTRNLSWRKPSRQFYPYRFLCCFLRAKICNFSYGIYLAQSPSAIGAIWKRRRGYNSQIAHFAVKLLEIKQFSAILLDVSAFASTNFVSNTLEKRREKSWIFLCFFIDNMFLFVYNTGKD